MLTTKISSRAKLRATTIAAFSILAFEAMAHDYKVGGLQIDHPWSRATPAGAQVAGGFMKITNSGREADRLVGGSFAASGVVEIHEMKMDAGVMKMRALEKGLEIKPGESVEFKPGGYHMMFIDLKQPLKEGDTIKGELVFEKAGRVAVEYKVENLGAKSTPDAHSGHHNHSGHGAPKP